MALYIITNKTIKMANNGKGIGPRGLGAPKSIAKYSSLKQTKKPEEPKTGGEKKLKQAIPRNFGHDYERPASAIGQDIKRGITSIYTAITDKDPTDAPEWMQTEATKKAKRDLAKSAPNKKKGYYGKK